MKRKNDLFGLLEGIVMLINSFVATILLMLIIEPLFFCLPFKLVLRKDRRKFKGKLKAYKENWKSIIRVFK